MRVTISKEMRRGFTIIEVIISFTILTLALSGFSGMVVSSIRSFRQSEERFVAAKIAQEGMELAQNKKDNHVQCVAADTSCPIASNPPSQGDWQNNLLGDWQVESSRINDLLPTGKFLTYTPTNYICMLTTPAKDSGKFGYCGGSSYMSAKYTREVKISRLNDYSVLVVTTVRWGAGKSLVLQSVLFSDN